MTARRSCYPGTAAASHPLTKLGDPSAGTVAGEGKLSLGGVNAVKLGRRTPLGKQFGECAIAAADIDPSQAGGRGQPMEKINSDKPAPGAHHVLLGRAILKANLLVRHSSQAVI